jgi:hypothetical protein
MGAVRTVLLTRVFTTLGNRLQNPTPRKPAWMLVRGLRLYLPVYDFNYPE